MTKDKFTIGFLGLGNIGASTYKILNEKFGDKFFVKYALVRDLTKNRGDIPKNILTDNPDIILNDPEVDIIVEFLGGVEPAWLYMNAALKNGKSVVTANKAALAAQWDELNKSALSSGAGIYFEATCCTGIPLIRSLKGSLQANNISRLLGIINGTTNYILCKMKNDGLSYSEALASAQQKGLAEPDPSADVNGFDAANKLSILLSLAMRMRISIDNIFRESITDITMQDIEYGQGMGLCLKYLAIGKRNGNNIEARVHPTFIPYTHPLASVNDSYNAVMITGDIVEDLMFYGKGAGQFPTASALISDIVNAASTLNGLHPVFTEEVTVQKDISINKDWESEYFLRINLIDKPGMLARVAEIFGQCEISLAKVIQTGVNNSHAPVVFLTHKAFESNIQKAIQMINSLPKTDCKFGCLIRVESNI